MIEPLLLSATRVTTFNGDKRTNATGFFFEREGRLYVVTNRHVVSDPPSDHAPDHITIELHVNPDNVAECVDFVVPLYRDGLATWRQALDTGGPVDVVAIELHRSAMPRTPVLEAFTPTHLQRVFDEVEVGTPLLVVGFPLGFHDTLHRLPVVRQAVIASSFGLRFQGQGFFLTDARTHRGTSGAPVVMRTSGARLPWKLLGVHSSRFDVGTRDREEDESLGLNSAWYSDVLLALTEATP